MLFSDYLYRTEHLTSYGFALILVEKEGTILTLERDARFRSDDTGLWIVLEHDDPRRPRSEVRLDGAWQLPGSYGDPDDRHHRLPRAKAKVEVQETGVYRIAEALLFACPKCNASMGMREWPTGTERHAWTLHHVNFRAEDGPSAVSALYCAGCRSALGGDQGCTQHLSSIVRRGAE